MRRFASPTYLYVYTFTGLLAIAFLVAAFTRPIALPFAALFGTATVLGAYSFRRGDTAGIKISNDSLSWWCTGLASVTQSVVLADLSSVDYHHFDEDRIVLRLLDGTQLKLDHRFFGDGNEVLEAIRVRSPAVKLLGNGNAKYG